MFAIKSVRTVSAGRSIKVSLTEEDAVRCPVLVRWLRGSRGRYPEQYWEILFALMHESGYLKPGFRFPLHLFIRFLASLCHPGPGLQDLQRDPQGWNPLPAKMHWKYASSDLRFRSPLSRLQTPTGSHTIKVAEGQKILDAALDAGVDVPNSCLSVSCSARLQILPHIGTW